MTQPQHSKTGNVDGNHPDFQPFKTHPKDSDFLNPDGTFNPRHIREPHAYMAAYNEAHGCPEQKQAASSAKTPYELRWDILKEMISVTQNEWFTKKEIAERNADRSARPVEYIGDFPLDRAVERAETVYSKFICNNRK
jgi:hypothetical protein